MKETYRILAAVVAATLMVPAGLQFGAVAQPPPGGCDGGQDLRTKDPYVDVVGDIMCGNLDLKNHFLEFGGTSTPIVDPNAATADASSGSSGPIEGGIRFGNTELTSPAEGTLAFGGSEMCLDAGNCDFGDVNVTDTLTVNKTVSSEVVVDETLAVGNGSDLDNDTIFFDDGVSETLVWSDTADRYEMSNDLHVFGSLTSSSSEKFKTNITNLTGALETALAFRGVEFDRIEDDRHEVGFIAEEIAEVLPEVVVFDHKGDPIGLDYGRLTAILAEAIEAQQAQIQQLQEDIEEIQGPDGDLEERVQELEARLDELEERFDEHEAQSPGHAHGNE